MTNQVRLHTKWSVIRFVFLSFCLFVFLSFCLFVFLSFCLFVFLSLFMFFTIYDLIFSYRLLFLFFSLCLSIRESHKTVVSTFEARLLREKEALLPSGTRETRSTVKTTAASVPPEKSERKNVDTVAPLSLFAHSPENDSLFLKNKSICRTLIAIQGPILRY